MIVYQLTSPSGKSYVGVAIDLERRFSVHKSSPYPVGQMIRKYGPENIQKRVLLIGEPEYCYLMEERIIQAWGTQVPNGYNIAGGGQGVRHHPPELRKQMGIAISAALQRPATKAKLSARAVEQWSDPSNVEANRLGNLKAWSDPERLTRHSEIMKEINQRSDIRSASVSRAKAQWSDPEARAKLLAGLRRAREEKPS